MKFKILLSVAVLSLTTTIASAAQLQYSCLAVDHLRGQTLVAGQSFEMTVEDGIGINNYYGSPVVLRSSYLGQCVGQGKDNNNPSAEGWIGTAEIGGKHCAADGFDIFFHASLTEKKVDFIQVGVDPEETSYSCIRVK